MYCQGRGPTPCFLREIDVLSRSGPHTDVTAVRCLMSELVSASSREHSPLCQIQASDISLSQLAEREFIIDNRAVGPHTDVTTVRRHRS